MKTRSILKNIVLFPLTRIVVGIIVVSSTYNFFKSFSGGVFTSDIISNEWNRLITIFIAVSFAVLSYILLYRIYEKRNITELSTKDKGKNLLLGICIGGVLQSLTILVIYVTGGYQILSINNGLTFIIPSLIMALSSSILEELIFRGIIFRILEEKLGTYIALLISALLFGIIHLMNPNASLIAGLGLVIQAGCLLGIAYVYSRSLWLPIGIHFAWNFTQSGVFGAIVSGNKVGRSLITSNISGNELLTGGDFGPEGSIQATVFCSIAAIILVATKKMKKNTINPYWYN